MGDADKAIDADRMIETEWFRWLAWTSMSEDGVTRAIRALELVSFADFSDPRHAAAYELARETLRVGELHIANVLHADPDLLRGAGGDAYALSLFCDLPTGWVPGGVALSLESIAKHIHASARERKRRECVALALADTQRGDHASAKAHWDEAHWDEAPAGATVQTFGDLLRLQLMEHVQRDEYSDSRIPFGTPTMDRYFGGLDPGQCMIVGGRPSDGKSAVVGMAFALAWSRAGYRVGIVSSEDSERVFRQRLCALASQTSQSRFASRAALESDVINRLDQAQRDPMYGRIVLDVAVGQTLDKIAESITRLVRRERARVIVLDYIQAISVPGAEQRRTEVATVARTAKALCASLGVPLVMASQLKRYEGNIPTLRDLREAGDLEELAEMVLLLYRTQTGERMATIAKNKTGKAPITLRVNWDEELGACVGFEDA